MRAVAAFPNLQPASYQRHTLHADDRLWVEKNCYVDIYIELIHSAGCDPMAMLPFVLAIDFEGDQWTFFKPSHEEIRALYGLDTQELNIWRPLLDHVVEHLRGNKVVSTEADAFWLPDTQGTDYRRQHTKTTIAINDIDVDARRISYFHNASYYALEGEDFDRTFRVGEPRDPSFLPLFAETVRTDRVVRRPAAELRAMSRALLRTHVARRPADNPITRFERRFALDLPTLTEQGLDYYHQWAFATTRQLGAALELAALYLRWLAEEPLLPAADAFDAISSVAKTFILKAARSVNARRALDGGEMFAEMAGAWQRGMDLVSAQLER